MHFWLNFSCIMIKTYVKVNVNVSELGKITPVYIVFNDTRYNIDRVLDVRHAPNFDTGGMGIRYTIRVNGKVTHLWEENGKFYVNAV